MPLNRVTHPRGLNGPAIAGAVQHALWTTFDAPLDDAFQIVAEAVAGAGLLRSQSYRGITCSDQLPVEEIICRDPRSLKQKTALHAGIADIGVRREAIISTEVKNETWSFGGDLATFA